jgi:hypothetical protein
MENVRPQPPAVSPQPDALEIRAGKLLNWIQTELQNVSRLRSQLTPEQAVKLLTAYTTEEIWKTLEQMENHAQLAKKYVSVYLTLKNWIENQRTQKAAKGLYTHGSALGWLQRSGAGNDAFDVFFEPAGTDTATGIKLYRRKF